MKRCETELTATQHKALFEDISGGVSAVLYEYDGTVEMLFNNGRYQQMLNYTNEQYQAEVSDLFMLIHPDDVDNVRDTVFNLRHVGDTKELQCRLFTRGV